MYSAIHPLKAVTRVKILVGLGKQIGGNGYDATPTKDPVPMKELRIAGPPESPRLVVYA